ncbi:MAG: transposase [Planctomycetes bacterium]|nr:transposase [Planctomycetota bacterium]
MRPSDQVNYILAEWFVRAAHRHEVEVYAVFCASDHWHAILRCPRGNLDEFVRYFESYAARFLNVHWMRSGTVFPRRYSAEPILDDDALVDKIVYVLTNPAKSHLVETVDDWPGFSSAPEALKNQKRTFRIFHRSRWHKAGCPKDKSRFMEDLSLAIAAPPCWRSLSAKERARRLRELVQAREEEFRKARKAAGIRVLGVRAILAARRTDRPRHINTSPRPLCHASTKALWMEYRDARQRFVYLYRIASQKYRAGERGVEFPEGSFPPWLRKAG